MNIPKAPPWWVVFTFGAVYNAAVRCWWAVGFCLFVLACFYVKKKLVQRDLLGE